MFHSFNDSGIKKNPMCEEKKKKTIEFCMKKSKFFIINNQKMMILFSHNQLEKIDYN